MPTAVCVDADAWAEPSESGRRDDLELWEHSIALPEYDAVLTLLWQQGS